MIDRALACILFAAGMLTCAATPPECRWVPLNAIADTTRYAMVCAPPERWNSADHAWLDSLVAQYTVPLPVTVKDS